MKKIALTNQKGGVAKTSSAINLGAIIAAKFDKKVLLIDLDPQSNCSNGLGVELEMKDNCIYEAMMEDVNVNKVIISTDFNNLFLLPSHPKFSNAEHELVTKMSSEYYLKDMINNIEMKYDLILLDCPPNLGLVVVNAMAATDSIMIPVPPEIFSLDGINILMNTVMKIRERINPDLDVFGAFINMVDSRTNIEEDKKRVKDIFGKERTFDTILHLYKAVRDSQKISEPLYYYDKNAKATKEHIKLAKEVVNRVWQ